MVSARIYNYYISALKFSSKSNRTFRLITWIVLFICAISSLSFFYFILNNIDVISVILKSK